MQGEFAGNAPQDFDELVGLLNESFPNIRCLRCGFDKFYMLDGPQLTLPSGPLTDQQRPVMRLAYARCGYSEDHLTGVLRNSLENNRFENTGGE
jgi:hypothetical protein